MKYKGHNTCDPKLLNFQNKAQFWDDLKLIFREALKATHHSPTSLIVLLLHCQHVVQPIEWARRFSSHHKVFSPVNSFSFYCLQCPHHPQPRFWSAKKTCGQTSQTWIAHCDKNSGRRGEIKRIDNDLQLRDSKRFSASALLLFLFSLLYQQQQQQFHSKLSDSGLAPI